jgi:hypothetical protein
MSQTRTNTVPEAGKKSDLETSAEKSEYVIIFRHQKIQAKKSFENVKVKKKVKLSRYTPWRHMGGEEV